MKRGGREKERNVPRSSWGLGISVSVAGALGMVMGDMMIVVAVEGGIVVVWLIDWLRWWCLDA